MWVCGLPVFVLVFLSFCSAPSALYRSVTQQRKTAGKTRTHSRECLIGIFDYQLCSTDCVPQAPFGPTISILLPHVCWYSRVPKTTDLPSLILSFIVTVCSAADNCTRRMEIWADGVVSICFEGMCFRWHALLHNIHHSPVIPMPSGTSSPHYSWCQKTDSNPDPKLRD